jgi:hypothetical protein
MFLVKKMTKYSSSSRKVRSTAAAAGTAANFPELTLAGLLLTRVGKKE